MRKRQKSRQTEKARQEVIREPLDLEKVRGAAVREVLRIIGNSESRGRVLTLEPNSGVLVNTEYWFAMTLSKGKLLRDMMIVLDLGEVEAFGTLLQVAAGATSPEWSKPQRVRDYSRRRVSEKAVA